uniref:Uncharacterized protein n=1 Tax=Arundo donax TaxID=35708 RepID=A0A0A9B9P6_ARUDO
MTELSLVDGPTGVGVAVPSLGGGGGVTDSGDLRFRVCSVPPEAAAASSFTAASCGVRGICWQPTGRLRRERNSMISISVFPARSRSFSIAVMVAVVTGVLLTAALLGFPHLMAHGHGIVGGDWRKKNLDFQPGYLVIFPVKRRRRQRWGLKWCQPTASPL